ncbi:hypothetical protein WL29_22380 [Burkholderia ubonensis]|uniref:Uncharacterized protein n=1 Tax=Burkholderia ubonensis TaxID=101571 RepID=A0A106QBU9_9BURK|nr:hypothetical protein [Burkholderia ubonensis]KWA84115.1 hypothetical protein WL29_22380 [Burkholderia ubonensis]
MATAKARKLSEAQLRILRNLDVGQPWDAHISGRSAYGGATATVHSLNKLGYMANWRITDAGRAALHGTQAGTSVKDTA